MKAITQIFAFLLLFLLIGCATTPQVVTTEIAYSRSDGSLTIKSPKDVSIGTLNATKLPDGSVDLQLADYHATGNNAAIEAAGREAQSQAQLFGLIGQLLAPYLRGAPSPISPPPSLPANELPAIDPTSPSPTP